MKLIVGNSITIVKYNTAFYTHSHSLIVTVIVFCSTITFTGLVE